MRREISSRHTTSTFHNFISSSTASSPALRGIACAQKIAKHLIHIPSTLLCLCVYRNKLTFQREESIAKRRNFQPAGDDEENDDSDNETGAGGSSGAAETLTSMLQAVYTEDPNEQLDATMKFRKWVVLPGQCANFLLMADCCRKKRTLRSTRSSRVVSFLDSSSSCRAQIRCCRWVTRGFGYSPLDLSLMYSLKQHGL